MYYKTTYESPIGVMMLGSDGEGLIGLWNEGQKYHGDTLFPGMVERDDLEIFDKVREWLDRYFRGERPLISELNLAPIGSDFRQEVWGILSEISYGEVITYNDIAKEMARRRGVARMSCQAVGGAVGHNPLSVIVPCHRVVGVNGSLTGYAGGVEMKIRLLEHEGVDMSGLFVPEMGTAL